MSGIRLPSADRRCSVYMLLKPVINKTYQLDRHTFLFIAAGSGILQVDFRNYNLDAGKAIFLSPGQYFQLLHGNFEIDHIEFPGDEITQTENARYLFKHLVSLGYIDISRPSSYHLESLTCLSHHDPSLLNDAINSWLMLNPFRASKDEIDLLFDLKEVVDDNYTRPMSVAKAADKLNTNPYHLKRLTRSKLQQTIKGLTTNKLLTEAQKSVAFSDLSTKEIAYELGFSDPPYFNRFFKHYTQLTPGEFRNEFELDREDSLLSDLNTLIDDHFKANHKTAFYADQLNLSVKYLNKKIKEKTSRSPSEMIKDRLLQESKALLAQGIPVKEVAFELGFEEANHFSSHFKSRTGVTPTQFHQTFNLSTQ